MKKINFTNLLFIIIFVLMSFEVIYLSVQNKKLTNQLNKRVYATESKPDLPVGTQLPDLSFTLQNQDRIDLSAHNDKYFFVFFSTHCQACVQDADTWENMNELNTKNQVKMIGICKGDPDVVKEFMALHKLNFPVVPDPENEIVNQFGIKSFPSKCLVDENNKVVFYSRGSSGKRDLEQLKKIVPELQAG